MQIGQDLEKVTQAAVDGYYENDFFTGIDATKPVDDAANASRLRAIVQHCNIQFANQMRLYGAKYKITERPEELKSLDEDEGADTFTLDTTYEAAGDHQALQTHAQAMAWVHNVLKRSRGRELPGNFNPLLISQLFWEQSEPWEELASAHINRIAAFCERFVYRLVKVITSEDVFDKVMRYKVMPALEARFTAAHGELKKIIEDKGSHPITYNHYYTATIQKMRSEKQARMMKKLVKQHQSPIQGVDGRSHYELDTNSLAASLAATSVEEDMDRFSAHDALTSQMAYYKVRHLHHMFTQSQLTL